MEQHDPFWLPKFTQLSDHGTKREKKRKDKKQKKVFFSKTNKRITQELIYKKNVRKTKRHY